MRHALSRAALVPLVLALAACAAPGPGATTGPGATSAAGASSGSEQVQPEQVAESLMAALRDNKVNDAWAILSTGGAARQFNGQADFMAKMIAAGTPVEWSFEPLGYEGDDSGSYIVLQGPVTFKDGDTGRVRIRMQALGLQANPWRVEDFGFERG